MEELEKNQSQKKYKREQKKDNKAMLKGINNNAVHDTQF